MGKLRSNPIVFLLIAFTLCLGFSRGSLADQVLLKDGRVFHGEVTDNGAEIIVVLKYGTIRVPKKDVKAVIKDSPPRAATPKPKQPSKPSSPESSPAKPSSKPRPALPDLSARSQSKLKACLGHKAELLCTKHLAIVSVGQKAFIKDQAEFLERVYDRFFDEWAELGVSLKTPKTKLEVVYFSDEKAYKDYVFLNHDRMIGSEGFFSWAKNRSYFFNFARSRFANKAKARVAKVEAEIKEFKQRLAVATGFKQRLKLQSRLQQKRDYRTRLKRHHKAVIRESSQCIAAHELIHQLCCNTGLIPGREGMSTWFTEGLALMFEELALRSPKDWSKPLAEHNKMRIQWLALAAKEKRKTMPLKSLLSTSGSLISDGGPVAYSQLWLLMHCLFFKNRKKYRAALVKFLKDLRSLYEEDEELKDEDRWNLFRICFKIDLKVLERDCLKAQAELLKTKH